MNHLVWHQHLPAIVTAAIMLGVAWWAWVIFTRLRLRFDQRSSLILLLPRLAVAALLLVALLDPWLRTTAPPTEKPGLLLLLDDSKSMAVADRPDRPRLVRGQEAAAALTKQLADVARIETTEFDGDIPALCASLGPRVATSGVAAAVLVTDGGDEPVRPAALPVPLHVLAVGSDPKDWNDVAISEIEAPERIDVGTGFRLTTRLVARAAAASFRHQLSDVAVTVEERIKGKWKALRSKKVDLGSGAAQVVFDIPADAGSRAATTADEGPAARTFRVAVAEVEGELSPLDNAREFAVAVGSRRIHVLFFARSLDWNFSQIRAELRRDPDVRLTALYRKTPQTMALEGDRRQGDDVLEQGMPEDAAVLDRYRPVILGAFPAEELSESQAVALREYVDRGGAVVILGGADAMGGGWCDSPLEPLLPWKPRREAAAVLTGEFPVVVPAPARDHPAMRQAAEALAAGPAPTLASLNDVGDLKPGAIPLLDVSADGAQRSVVAIEPYGRGQAVGVATDTMWQWRRRSGAGREAFGIFWQELVRSLAGSSESAGGIRVEWDRPSYRPSEAAVATVSVATRRDTAAFVRGHVVVEGEERPVTVSPVPGVPGKWTVAVKVGPRAPHVLVIEAVAGSDVLARLESGIVVQPRPTEGSRLEVDVPFLTDLAGRSGGTATVEDVLPIARAIRGQLAQSAVAVEQPLVQKAYVFPAIVLLVLVAEWLVRRRFDLV
ncbi:MAG: hypothetical protein NTW36_04715 [Planctomycetia bacterium]|nr:hypothetical protein [Planctomycetia bacterium]